MSHAIQIRIVMAIFILLKTAILFQRISQFVTIFFLTLSTLKKNLLYDSPHRNLYTNFLY
jgi:hypothetical protein